jgi:dihydrofolate reductase
VSIAIAEVVMGNVFVHTMMSLDGFITGPKRRHELGLSARRRPEARGLFEGRWKGPHFILTHAPPTDETHPAYSFRSGDVRDAVATAQAAAGGRDVLVLGANVVNQCLGAGLIDEILMHVVPELVGDGVRLFDVPTVRASLKTLDVSASGQVVNLRVRVDKPVA